MKPIGPRNMQVSAYDALRYKRQIGDRVRWTQDPLDGAVNRVLGESYGKTKDALNAKLGSDFAELNERYANLVGAKKAINRRMTVAERNDVVSLKDLALAASGHPLLAAARKGLGTTAVRTRGARMLHNLPDRFAVQHPGAIVAPVAMAAKSAEPQRKQGAPPTAASISSAAPGASDDFYGSIPDAPEAPPSLADAISKAEGFGSPDTIPARANNPGDLKLGDQGHGVMRAADGQEITIFGTPQEGRAALEDQLEKIYSGRSKYYTPDMTLEEFGQIYSGGGPDYGANLAGLLGVEPTTTLGELGARQQAAEEEPAPQPEPAPEPPATSPEQISQEAQSNRPSQARLRVMAGGKQNPPNKKYAKTAKGPNGHLIGSDDNMQTWYDIATGKQVA
jgi:hypothetical protein